ncbi:unnamed protein product [Closterium sp. NIES-53]
MPGRIEAAALGSSESAVALGAGESAAALGARESADALGDSASTSTGPASTEALHTFTPDSGAERCFFQDCTRVTPLAAPVPVSLADPTGGPVVARASTILPCLAVPSGSLSGLHLPAFSTNLLSNAVLQDEWVDTFIPGGQRVAICKCSRSGRHLATSGDCLESGVCVWSPCSVLLVSGTLSPDSPLAPPPRSPLAAASPQHALPSPCHWPSQVPSLPPALACLAVTSLRRGVAARHSSLLRVSSEFPPTSAPLQTLHMDVCGPAPVDGTDQERGCQRCFDPLDPYYSSPTAPAVLSGLVRDAKASNLSSRTLRCVFLGFPTDAPPWQFYHPRSRRVFNSQDATFDESVCFYSLHPYASHPTHSPWLSLWRSLLTPLAHLRGVIPSLTTRRPLAALHAWRPPLCFPPRPSLPPPQPAAVDSRVETAGAELGGAEIEGEGSWGAATSGAVTRGAGFGSAATGVTGSGGAATGGADSGGPASPSGGGAVGDPDGGPGVGHLPQPDRVETLSPQAIRAWIVRRGSPGGGGYGTTGAGAANPGGTAGAGGTKGITGGAGGANGAASASAAGAAGAGGAGAAGTDSTHASTPVRARCVARPRHPAVQGTHGMTLRPSSVPQRLVLPEPPTSSLPHVPEPESDLACAASPIVTRLLVTVVTDPEFESTAAFSLVTELVEFAARSRLDYVASLVIESKSVCPLSVGGEPALSSEVLDDRQFELECLEAALPHFASMLLCPEGDPDALDIPTPRSYAEVIAGTYVDEVPPLVANIVDGMWIFRVKRLPSSPPALKVRYVARGFSQRQGVNFFQTFSPTPKMTTLRSLLHVAAQRDYELHSLDFSTAFLQGSLPEEIWLRCPPCFTGSFPAGTQWSLRRPVYSLREAPREWHDTLRTTLGALGFDPSSADPSLFQRTDTTLLPFYVLVTRSCRRDTPALTWVLQRFGFQFSSPQPTPLSTGHSLSAPPSDESVELSGPYPEVVGCLMYLMTCIRFDLAYPLSLLACYVALGRHRKAHWDAAKRVLRYFCEAELYAGAMAAQELRWLTYLLSELRERPRSPPVLYVDNKAMLALCHEQRLEHRTKHIDLRYFLAHELQQRRQLRLSYVASRANAADVFTKALGSGDHQRFCTALGLVPTLPHLLIA